MAAASQMAQHIDGRLVQELSKNAAMAINGGKWPKGKL
jgi:ribosomal protein S6E (S10)